MSVALLPPQMIGPAPVTLYAATAPAKVLSAMLTNSTGIPCAVTVFIKRNAGEVVPVLSGFALASSQVHVATELMKETLSAGDSIVAMATVEGSAMAVIVVLS